MRARSAGFLRSGRSANRTPSATARPGSAPRSNCRASLSSIHAAEGHLHALPMETSCESQPVLKTRTAARPYYAPRRAGPRRRIQEGGMMRRSLRFISIAAAMALVLGFTMREARTQSASCFVSTSNGAVQGVDRGAPCAFLGVPYGASTGGARRWRPPQPADPRAPAIRTCDGCSHICPGFSAATRFPQGSEDCLKVIIWTPDPLRATPAPVLIWLHPRAFVAASANLAAANGQRFAEETGTIVVAANYPRGPFGFLAHAALSAEDAAYPSSGNYGLLDQRAAFAWVRDHIAIIPRRSRARHDCGIIIRRVERGPASGVTRQRGTLSSSHHSEWIAHVRAGARPRKRKRRATGSQTALRLPRSPAGVGVHAIAHARPGAERTPDRVRSDSGRTARAVGAPSLTAWSCPISRARCSRAAPLPECR